MYSCSSPVSSINLSGISIYLISPFFDIPSSPLISYSCPSSPRHPHYCTLISKHLSLISTCFLRAFTHLPLSSRYLILSHFSILISISSSPHLHQSSLIDLLFLTYRYLSPIVISTHYIIISYLSILISNSSPCLRHLFPLIFFPILLILSYFPASPLISKTHLLLLSIDSSPLVSHLHNFL